MGTSEPFDGVSDVLAAGALRKLRTELAEPVRYQLPVGESLIELNPLLGKTLRLRYLGQINCIHCGRKTSKSFNQGYCFPCFRRLARCDSCIVKPEKCHYFAGTCREPQWGEQHCLTDHYVYLANSSGLKVGITRGSQIPTRWVDQGASQALPILRVANRLQSGLVEVALAAEVADKTNWRALLKGEAAPLDLAAEREAVLRRHTEDLSALREQFGADAIEVLEPTAVTAIRYPVLAYPTKVVSTNFNKHQEVGGKLMGIKGQYLLFDTGVINIRNFAGYQVEVRLA